MEHTKAYQEFKKKLLQLSLALVSQLSKSMRMENVH